MPANEIVFETNLDLEKTIENLMRLRNQLHLSIVYEKGTTAPPGIAYLTWKASSGNRVTCNFGSRGGLDIHYDKKEDVVAFKAVLAKAGVTRDGQGLRFVLTKEFLGRGELAGQIGRLELREKSRLTGLDEDERLALCTYNNDRCYHRRFSRPVDQEQRARFERHPAWYEKWDIDEETLTMMDDPSLRPGIHYAPHLIPHLEQVDNSFLERDLTLRLMQFYDAASGLVEINDESADFLLIEGERINMSPMIRESLHIPPLVALQLKIAKLLGNKTTSIRLRQEHVLTKIWKGESSSTVSYRP